MACEDGKWIRHIQRSAFEENAFIRKRGTFGNEKWMIKRVWLPFYVAQCTIVRFVNYFSSFVLYIVHTNAYTNIEICFLVYKL